MDSIKDEIDFRSIINILRYFEFEYYIRNCQKLLGKKWTLWDLAKSFNFTGQMDAVNSGLHVCMSVKAIVFNLDLRIKDVVKMRSGLIHEILNQCMILDVSINQY